MYLTETDIVLSWTILAASFPERVITKDVFDIVLVDPEGNSQYLVDPLDAGTWIPPVYYDGDGPDNGYATYTFNQIRTGRYQVHLVSGTAAGYTILNTEQLYIWCDFPGTVITDLTAQSVRFSPPNECPPPEYLPTVTSSFSSKMYRIYGVGRGGPDNDIVVVSGYGTAGPMGSETNREYLMISDLSLTEETYSIRYTDLPGWKTNFSPRIAFIEYSPTMDIWVFANDEGLLWWSEDLVTYTQCYNQMFVDGIWWEYNQNIKQMHYYPDQEYFQATSTRNHAIISYDGKNWNNPGVIGQSISSANQSGSVMSAMTAGGKKWDILTGNAEYYYYREVAASQGVNADGWTFANPAEGIWGGVGGTWTFGHMSTDGIVIVGARFGYLTVVDPADLTAPDNQNPGIWSDGDGIGYDFADLGMGQNFEIETFGYYPKYERPWIMNITRPVSSGPHEWWDCAEISKDLAGGNWALSTNPDFVKVDQALNQPRSNKNFSPSSLYKCSTDASSTWGLGGGYMVIQRITTGTIADPDYILFQP